MTGMCVQRRARRLGLAFAVACAAGAAAAGAAHAAISLTLDPVGGEVAPTIASGNESNGLPAVAKNDDGDFVVAWRHAFGDESEIWVRAYRADATPRSGEVRVATETDRSLDLTNPSVAISESGDFVVTWLRDALSGNTQKVGYTRRYTASATPATASRRLAEPVQGDLLLERNAVGMNGSGTYTIVFSKAGTVFTRRYDNDGSATRADSQTGRDEEIVRGGYFPAIATASTGATVVHYQIRLDDAASGVPTWWSVARRVEPAGSPARLAGLGTITIEQVKYYGSGGTVGDVADDGSFVATFLDTVVGERVLDPALNGPLKLFVKHYDAAGAPTDTERVNQGSERTVLDGPQAAISNSGRNWVVTWADDPGRDGQGTSVRARSFARGQRGPATQVNVTPDGDQQLPAVAMGSGGQAILAWQSTVRFTLGLGTGFAQTFWPTATLVRRFDVDGGGRESRPWIAAGAPLSAERVEATANDAALPLDLSCPAQQQATCTFDVTARAPSATLGASVAASAVAGRRTFRVRSGRVTAVQLGLSRAARAALRARGRLALRMTVVARASSTPRTYRGPVTLLARQASATPTAAGVANVRVLGGRWVSEADAVVRAFDGKALAATARLRTAPGLVRSVRLALGAAQRAKLRAGRAVRLRIVVSERNPLAAAVGDLEPAMRILVQRAVTVLPPR